MDQNETPVPHIQPPNPQPGSSTDIQIVSFRNLESDTSDSDDDEDDENDENMVPISELNTGAFFRLRVRLLNFLPGRLSSKILQWAPLEGFILYRYPRRQVVYFTISKPHDILPLVRMSQNSLIESSMDQKTLKIIFNQIAKMKRRSPYIRELVGLYFNGRKVDNETESDEREHIVVLTRLQPSEVEAISIYDEETRFKHVIPWSQCVSWQVWHELFLLITFKSF